jgi:DNA-binding XRE family transcriptional regulator
MEIAVSLTEKRARNGASEPESELVKLITKIVDEILKNRRMRPMPAQAGMSKKQFAISVGVSVSTVEAAIREGELEALKVRKRTIITPTAGERWLANRPRIQPARRESTGADSESAAL